jgi:hypothetical protein
MTRDGGPQFAISSLASFPIHASNERLTSSPHPIVQNPIINTITTANGNLTEPDLMFSDRIGEKYLAGNKILNNVPLL